MKKIQEYVTSDVLKIIALFAMTLEHTGTFLSNGLHPLVLLGRIAYPIFAYLIIYHVYQTGVFVKYIKRLLFFGVISGIILFPFHVNTYHIFFSFLVPILYLYLVLKIDDKPLQPVQKDLLKGGIFALCLLASVPLNYSFIGFLYMVALYQFFKYRTPFWIAACLILGALLNPLDLDYALVSGATTLFLLIFPPKETRVRHRKYKWFFYLYYPLHLALLKAISLF